MSELTHHQLSEHLRKPADRTCQLFLLHGEPTLVDHCLEQVVDHLLDGHSCDMCCEALDGLVENIPEALTQLNTYALSVGPKLVVFKDAKLFDAQGDQQRLLEQIKEAYTADRVEKATKALMALCHRLAVDIMDLNANALPAELDPLGDALGSDGLARLLEHGRQLSGANTSSEDPLEALLRAVEKGFPPQHALLITVNAKVPKNRKLYKSIEAKGLVVDCSIPLGERRADKMAQETVLRQTLERLLSAAGKKIAPSLLATLTGLTGFDLPTFIQNVEKLIDYVGERSEIRPADVQALLRRTKIDPIYELGNAVADRNVPEALKLLNGLLKTDWHPLQIVATLANQIRRLLVAKDFSVSQNGRDWSRSMTYAQFQKMVLPAIQAYDKAINDQIAAWPGLSPAPVKSKAGTPKSSSDLALAANPNNAFPIYQTLLKSENYSLAALVSAMHLISQADVRLKSTGQEPAQVLSVLILSICAPEGP